MACDPVRRNGQPHLAPPRARRASEDQATRPAVRPQDLASYLDALAEPRRRSTASSPTSARSIAWSISPRSARWPQLSRAWRDRHARTDDPRCALEALYFMATRRPTLARRRRAAGRRRRFRWPASTCRRSTTASRTCAPRSAPSLSLAGVEGIGVAIPPPYLEPRWQHAAASRSASMVTPVDGWLAPWPPFNRVGDHVLLHFEKEHGSCLTCCSARRTSCASTPSCGEPCSRTRRLGTLYAASYLRATGHSVALLRRDAGRSPRAEWAAASTARNRDFAVLYEDSFNYLSKMCLLRMRQAALRMIDAGADARLRGHRVRLRCDRSSGRVSARRRDRGDPGRRRSHARRADRTLVTSGGSPADVAGVALPRRDGARGAYAAAPVCARARRSAAVRRGISSTSIATADAGAAVTAITP